MLGPMHNLLSRDGGKIASLHPSAWELLYKITSKLFDFFWRDSDNKLSASRGLGRFSFIGLLVSNFMLDQTVHNVFLGVLVDLLLQYRVGKSTHSRL